MATAAELAEVGVLQRLNPVLDDDEQELRLVYLSEKLAAYLRDVLPTLESFHGKETRPDQDLDAFIATFASGLPVEFDRQIKAFIRKSFHPLEGGVWYFKTPDLRIFGWFYAKDCFIGVVADTFERVKSLNLYEGYRNEVIRFRNNLDLDEPKFIPGDNPDAVISNYDLTN